MKIISRETFLLMPEGTLFSKYEPCVFGPLCIKGQTIGANDFLVQKIADSVDASSFDDFSQILFKSQQSGKGFKIDLNCEGRDGMFEDDQLFAVWEIADVESLIQRLQMAVAQALKDE